MRKRVSEKTTKAGENKGKANPKTGVEKGAGAEVGIGVGVGVRRAKGTGHVTVQKI